MFREVSRCIPGLYEIFKSLLKYLKFISKLADVINLCFVSWGNFYRLLFTLRKIGLTEQFPRTVILPFTQIIDSAKPTDKWKPAKWMYFLFFVFFIQLEKLTLDSYSDYAGKATKCMKNLSRKNPFMFLTSFFLLATNYFRDLLKWPC